VEEPFTAPVRQQVDGEWLDVDTEVSDWAICKPNNALKKVLAAEPIIDRENPAILRVLSHDEYNGFPTAKCVLKCASFVEDPESFDLSF
jgi:hypothetical protein